MMTATPHVPSATIARTGRRPDDHHIFRCLDSSMYGALAHVTTAATTLVEADLGVSRVFGVDDRMCSRCVVGVNRRLEPELFDALWTWPFAKGSMFASLAVSKPRDGVHRPDEWADEMAFERQLWFRSLERVISIRDILCICVPLDASNWLAIALINHGDSPSFTDADRRRLSHLLPNIARQMHLGLRRDRSPHGDQTAMNAPPPAELPARMAKLSKTERHVLHHLRQGLTERQVAGVMDRSPHTVHVHVKNIYRKLGIGKRRELLAVFDGQPHNGNGSHLAQEAEADPVS